MKRSIAKPRLPLLSYALLGLLQQKPSSGYELRKIFSETPMANLSDSPGAIYPALRRLEKQKLVSGSIAQGAGLRRSRMMRVTPAGITELKLWLKAPIEESDVAHRMAELLLRFAFFDRVLGGKSTLEFLQKLEAVLKVYVPGLQQYLASHGSKMQTSARLALENGVLGYAAQLKWSAHAIATYKRKLKSL